MDPSLQNKTQKIKTSFVLYNIGLKNMLSIMKSSSSNVFRYKFNNNYSVSLSISSSSSCMGLLELVQPDPLQLPQAGEHFTLCFLHVHLTLLQSV